MACGHHPDTGPVRAILLAAAAICGCSGPGAPAPRESGAPAPSPAADSAPSHAGPAEQPAEAAADAPGISARDQSSPQATVDSFMRNLRDGFKNGCLALGTQEWQVEELAATRSFFNAVFLDEIEVQRWEFHKIKEDGDAAWIDLRALLVAPNGEIDNEPMRFQLLRIDDKWWISNLS